MDKKTEEILLTETDPAKLREKLLALREETSGPRAAPFEAGEVMTFNELRTRLASGGANCVCRVVTIASTGDIVIELKGANL